jgi:hypothetical protein
MSRNHDNPFRAFYCVKQILFSLDSDFTQYILPGKTGHLTDFQKGNSYVLKNTPGEFLDAFPGPFRMGKLQIAPRNASMT